MHVRPGPNPGATLHAALARVCAVAVALSVLILPAPAAAALPPDVPTEPAALLAPAPDAAMRAAERATRDFNRRPVPRTAVVAVAGAQPAAPVTQAAKPATKKPKVVKRKTSSVGTKPKNTPKTESVSVPASGRAAVVVAFARAALGSPYVFGAAGPRAFDCSGLVMAAYRSIGIRLPHKASAFYGVGRAVPRSQLQPGDILIMAGGSHAGIYIGNGLMIHAPHPGARVEVAPIWSLSAARRMV